MDLEISRSQYQALIRSIGNDSNPYEAISVPTGWKSDKFGKTVLHISKHKLRWGEYEELTDIRRSHLKRAYTLLLQGVFSEQAIEVESKPSGIESFFDKLSLNSFGRSTTSAGTHISDANSLFSTQFEKKRKLGKAQFECDVVRWAIIKSAGDSDIGVFISQVDTYDVRDSALKYKFGESRGRGLVFQGPDQVSSTFYFKYEDDAEFRMYVQRRYLG